MGWQTNLESKYRANREPKVIKVIKGEKEIRVGRRDRVGQCWCSGTKGNTGSPGPQEPEGPQATGAQDQPEQVEHRRNCPQSQRTTGQPQWQM